MKKNLYELLEVSPEATPEQIKLAMVRLGKKYATKSQMNESARAHFNQIKEAYKVLSSPYRRASYDDSLRLNQEKLAVARRRARLTQLKEWFIREFKHIYQTIIEWWRNQQHTIKELKIKEKSSLAGEAQPLKGWKFFKQRAATQYISNTLIPGEKIMFQAYLHWFFFLDIGALLLVISCSYLLIDKPDFIGKDVPTVSLWVPKLVSNQPEIVSVWYLGLIVLWLISVLMLWEAFIIKQTTQLAITTKRIIAQSGFFNRTVIEVKLRRFESITINQNLLGRLFNYGTITITGMGGVKTIVPNIMAPVKFKKILWQVLEYLGHAGDDDD
jgi:curved DNA-binding protein CbpA